MKRRNFLKIFPTAAAAIAASPASTAKVIAAGSTGSSSSQSSTQCTVRCAHLRPFDEIRTLEDKYINYAVACHAVHDRMADQLFRGDIPVESLEFGYPSQPEPEELDQLRDIDVYSVSTVLNQIHGRPVGYAQKLEGYREFFKSTTGIGVFAAGITDETAVPHPYNSLAQMGDTVLMVGEAQGEKPNTFIAANSEKTQNISLLAANPLRKGMHVPFINQDPGIAAKDIPLIEYWLSCRDAMDNLRIPYESMDKNTKAVLQEVHNLMKNTQYRTTLNERAQAEFGDLPRLHEKVLETLHKRFDIDVVGEATNLSGPGFAAPAVAAALSVAKYYEKCDESAGKPFLRSADLVALALLSATPVTKQEGGIEIPHQANGRGLLTSTRTGFGLFDSKKFAQNLANAKQKLLLNHELQSDPQRLAKFVPIEAGKVVEEVVFDMQPDGNGEENLITTRVNINFDYDENPPNEIILISPVGAEYNVHITHSLHPKYEEDSAYPYAYKCWGATDQCLGDLATGRWTVKCPGAQEGFKPAAIRLTVHGVAQGSIIDTMINDRLQEQQKEAEKKKGKNKEKTRN